MGRITIIILMLSAMLSCDTEQNVTPRYTDYFVKYYGGEGNQIGVDLKVQDDGFIVLGNDVSVNGRSQILLVKTDQIGNQQWAARFGGAKNATAAAMQVDAEGNYIIAATTQVSGTKKDIMILKVAPNGDEITSRAFGSADHDEVASSILVTGNGDYILMGYTTNVLAKPDTSLTDAEGFTDTEDIYTIRTSSELTKVDSADWREIIGSPGADRGVGIIEKDTSFLYFGTSDKTPGNNSQQDGTNLILFTVNREGYPNGEVDEQTFGTLFNETAAQIVKTTDGGFMMLGTSNDPDTRMPFVARVRSSLELVRDGVVPTENDVQGKSVFASAYGGFIMLGEMTNNTHSDIYLAKLTANGAIKWERSFGGQDNDRAAKVLELANGSIVFIGTVELESQQKICLIKVSETGELKP